MDDSEMMMDRSPAPDRRRPRTARAGLLGAVVGVGASVGALVLATGGATADPGSGRAETGTAPTAITTTELGGDTGFVIGAVGPDDEQWEAHWDCVDEVFEGESGFEARFEALEESDADDVDWESLEAEIDAAVADCDALLPPGVLAELEVLDEAFADFEECLDSQYGDEDEWHLAEPGDVVVVETADGSTIVEFGEGDGEVVITKADGSIDIVTDGDVTAEVIDWDDLVLDEGVEQCEHLLPDEDLILDGIDGLDVDELLDDAEDGPADS